jgi:hypothetical protein
MNSNRMTALALVAAGLLLIAAGPLLPGGERVVVNDPPRSGHVTDLARADDGSILAGTQDGELWRLADGLWGPVMIDLGGQPVTALAADLSGDAARGPIGTAGGLVNGPAGLPALTQRISDEAATEAGLVVATGDGVLVQGTSAWEQHLAGINVYRLELQQVQGRDYLHVGTVGQGVFTAAVDDLERWAPNSDGLPDQGNLFSFAVSAGGRLIAGTSSGLFWQQNPGAPWQRLRVGLEQSRILSLHLEPAAQERQRLWIGGDDGLFRVDLLELDDGLEAAAYAEPITPPAPGLDFGVSWIVPMDGGVLFSAGGIYQFGAFGLVGWYWISMLGAFLVVLGGWLFPPRVQTAAA